MLANAETAPPQGLDTPGTASPIVLAFGSSRSSVPLAALGSRSWSAAPIQAGAASMAASGLRDAIGDCSAGVLEPVLGAAIGFLSAAYTTIGIASHRTRFRMSLR